MSAFKADFKLSMVRELIAENQKLKKQVLILTEDRIQVKKDRKIIGMLKKANTTLRRKVERLEKKLEGC